MLDTILSLFYRYVDITKGEAAQKIQEAAGSATLKPLRISSANSVSRVKRSFDFIAQDPTIDSAKEFPFSEFVLETFNAISDFINNFYVFLEGVPQQSSELDDIAKKVIRPQQLH